MTAYEQALAEQMARVEMARIALQVARERLEQLMRDARKQVQ